MQLRNSRSAKISLLFLIPVGLAIYHWLQYRSLLHYLGVEYSFGVDKVIDLVLSLAAAAYFLWHAFRGQPQSDSKDTDLLAVGMISFVLAVALTLNGLGYQFHVLKIMVLALLYVTAALLLWDAFKKRFASAHPDRS